MGPVVVLREECWRCLRDCEAEVEREGRPIGLSSLASDRELCKHGVRCLMCGATQTLLYWSGEIDSALRSATYAAA